MILKHLSLSNFRSYLRLDTDIPRRILLLSGGNAQGKTTLLESLFYCASFSSPLSAADRQLIHFNVLDDPIAVARMITEFERDGRFFEDVEDDPPTKPLLPDDIDYLHKTPIEKIKTKVAFAQAHKVVDKLIKNKQLIIKDTGVLAGVEVAKEIIAYFDPECRFEQFLHDGDWNRRSNSCRYVYPDFYPEKQ